MRNRRSRDFLLLAALLAELFLAGRGITAQSSQDMPQVERYAKFERLVDIPGTYKNPFDPAQADVNVTFTAPSGKKVVLPAFWMQPFQDNCAQNCTTETLVSAGDAGWRFRFAPDEIGLWQYSVNLRDINGQRDIQQGRFSVVDSKQPGFIRVSANQRYFVYESGAPYFPIGSNLGWSWDGGGGTLTYLRWLQELKKVDANYGRLYLDVPWFISLEAKPPVGDYTNAQQDAWKLDTILDAAAENGIALQLVLLSSQLLNPYSYPPLVTPSIPARPDTRADWSTNPYSYGKGGPLANPTQFITGDAGQTLFRRRLRYIVARWGYSPAIFAWELIDQIDRAPAPAGQVSEWLRSMADTLRKLDPAGHLITAGLRDSAKSGLLNAAKLDFSAVRSFQRRPIDPGADQVTTILNALNPTLKGADRPVLLTEFSLNPWFEPTADDPTGIHVREAMWAAALSGAAGSAMSAWWDTYLFPQKLTPIDMPLAAFVADVPWGSADLRPVQPILLSDSKEDYRVLKLSGFNPILSSTRAPDIVFPVGPDGVDPMLPQIPSFLFGATSPLNRPLKLSVAPPVDGLLTVTVKRVSPGYPAKLTISVDGRINAQLALTPNNRPTSLSVLLSAGQHDVVIDNAGQDYLQIDSIELESYVAPLRAVALSDPKAGIFIGWLQNRDYTWDSAQHKTEPKPANLTLQVPGMAPGAYLVQLWDPFSGNIAGEETQTMPAGADTLTVRLLPVTQMLAVRVFRKN